MPENTTGVWIRKNGIGHAWSREFACDCDRCRTINFTLATPPSTLAPFSGWNDPPWRAHTSASIFVGNAGEDIQGHVLIDCGAGVVESLMCSGLRGLGTLSGLLITHWHPDHFLSLNQLCESLRRHAKRTQSTFRKLPVYCTLPTYDWLRSKKGLDYEFTTFLRLQEIVPEVPFSLIAGGKDVRFTPLPVAHGTIEGAVIFAAEIEDKKVVFCWDIDVPDTLVPNDKKKRTNQQVVDQLHGYAPDILFLESNTWAASGTGHSSFESGQSYINTIKPQKVYITHLSGHEDSPGTNGYGWSDSVWENAVAPFNVMVARQGMVIKM